MRPARIAGSQGGNEQQGLEAGFEQKAGRKRLDVLAHVDSLRVVLEGLTGFHTKAQAIKDADAGCPDAGARGRMESAAVAQARAAVDLAILGVLADGGLRRSEAAALT